MTPLARVAWSAIDLGVGVGCAVVIGYYAAAGAVRAARRRLRIA